MRFTNLIPACSSLLAACGAQPPTTITIKAGPTTAFVAFRDPSDTAWQPATKISLTSYQLQVAGPYLVAVACNHDGRIEVSQIGRTLDDLPLGPVCPPSSGSYKVTGHMAQSGTMVFGPHLDISSVPAWTFQFDVDRGAYDLLALTGDRIAVQRQVAVTGDLVISPTVDVDSQGTALTGVALSAANAAAGETLQAKVELATADSAPAEVYVGPSATAKVAPEAVLIATDRQTVSLQALRTTPADTIGRSVRRPFRVGGDTVYTLPPPLSGEQWTVENNQLVVSWTSRPDADDLIATASGSGSGTLLASSSLDLSAAFLAATQITRATLATDIPGYEPGWQVDRTRMYTRELEFQNVTGGVTTSIWHTEAVTAAPPPPRRRGAGLACPGYPSSMHRQCP